MIATSKRFESFIVVRTIGDHTEIHTVGASGTALDELLDMIESTLTGQLDTSDEGLTMIRIGAHPDAPTGIRVLWVDHDEAVAAVLRSEFESVHVAA